jgi:diguanylate cyclase
MLPPTGGGTMRFATFISSLAGGSFLGSVATLIAIPSTRESLWSIAISDPTLTSAALVAFAIPVILYALAKHENEITDQGANDDQGSETKAARAELQKQFGRFLDLIGKQLESSERHASSLNSANDRLNTITSDIELRAVLRELVASNETYRQESVELNRRLKDAQEQTTMLNERAKAAEKLASVDALTGVANRRKLDEELDKQVALSHAEELPLCLMMADIDHFKSVNDRLGHRAGDAVLRQFAELLSGMIRTTDTIARYGGEEFAIILPRAPLGNAYEIAERIRKAVETHSWKDIDSSVQLVLTASFGIADIRDEETAVDLINRADKKLYEAKTHGRNRTMIWSSAA